PHPTLARTREDMSGGYRTDPALVRGLEYSTRTTSEISTFHEKQQNALCGGGRYDPLVEKCGGPATPAVGFSLGIDRVVQHLYDEGVDYQRCRQAPVDVYMACLGDAAQGYALVHAERLRGIYRVEVDTSGRGVKAQMKSAHTRAAKLVIIAGDEEIAGECFQLKHLDTGHQQEVANVKLLETVREVLGS
ncbi:ATP phosphoribosyltransferase regulatory subunit, partial [bacterium]|nr:ATP phosphoribosyltransferase regulatory subunit [bacterium]